MNNTSTLTHLLSASKNGCAWQLYNKIKEHTNIPRKCRILKISNFISFLNILRLYLHAKYGNNNKNVIKKKWRIMPKWIVILWLFLSPNTIDLFIIENIIKPNMGSINEVVWVIIDINTGYRKAVVKNCSILLNSHLLSLYTNYIY